MFKTFFRRRRSCEPLVESVHAVQKADFLRSVTRNSVQCELVRIGGAHDGGYLIPDVLSEIQYCFSAGVGDVAEFERRLISDYRVECFLCDASIDRLPAGIEVARFEKKFLSSRSGSRDITLSDWIAHCVPERRGGMLLQMDIEGGEFEVLAYESAEVLGEFSLMVIEFHNLHEWGGSSTLQMVNGIFEKIFKNFFICHIHPNNCGGVWRWGDVQTPRVVEVTFVHRKLLSALQVSERIGGAHALDAPNDPLLSAVELPQEWCKMT